MNTNPILKNQKKNPKMMFLLKCPKCKHDMKYQTTDQILTKKVKKCVYCGRSFKIRDRIIKRLK
jgi:uncharacterized protein YbaR (Trm112 family)